MSIIDGRIIALGRTGRIRAPRDAEVINAKTCNGSKTDTVESVADFYRLARELGCKAVSYYRDGSRDGQVLTTIKTETLPPAASVEVPELVATEPLAPVFETERAPNREDRR